jgi:hypothetical protein
MAVKLFLNGDEMDIFSKLTAYDLAGCIPPGFFLLAITDYLFGTDFVLNGQWDLPKGTLVIFMAYVGGHMIATPSSALLEKVVVHRWLGGPIAHMLWGGRIRWWQRIISADFFRPMDEYNRGEVISKLPAPIRHRLEDQAVFFHTYGVVKRDEKTAQRLANFLSLYGFCRNISFVSLFGSSALTVNELVYQSHGQQSYIYAAGLLLTAYLMFQRYLKFFRSYASEVLISYRAIS